MLKELFEKQAQLNKRTGFDPDALRADFDAQTAGIWLNNYIAAMSNELEELRDDRTTHPDVVFDEDEEVLLKGISGAHVELSLEIDTSDAEAVGVKVMCAPDGSEETAIWYVPGEDVLRVDVSRSTLREDVVYGSPPFTSYGIQAVGPEQVSIETVDAPLELPRGETLRLRIFIDGPMLEVFANDRQCLTQVVYTQSRDADGVKLCARGGPARIHCRVARVPGYLHVEARQLDSCQRLS